MPGGGVTRTEGHRGREGERSRNALLRSTRTISWMLCKRHRKPLNGRHRQELWGNKRRHWHQATAGSAQARLPLAPCMLTGGASHTHQASGTGGREQGQQSGKAAVATTAGLYTRPCRCGRDGGIIAPLQPKALQQGPSARHEH